MLPVEPARILGGSNELPLYRKARLIELRRNALLHARSLRPGSERNQQRQIARSLCTLSRSPEWLGNVVEGTEPA
jgi:hypothetical protein